MSGRIVLASERAVPGGAQLALGLFAPALRALGWDVRALVGEPGPLVDRFAACGIATTIAAKPRMALADQPTDLVLSMGAATHAWIGPSAAELGNPAAWWLELTLRGRPAEAAALAVPAFAAAALTETGAIALRQRLPDLPIEAIAPPVDPGSVERNRQRAVHLRTQLGLGPATTLLVMVARLDPIKGQDTVIDATARLLDAGRDVHLALVGGAVVGHEGDLVERLARQASDLGIADRVTFVGHLDDVGPWHAATDISVHASAHEAFGMTLVEALAHGAPVVASTTEGPRSVLADGRFGVLVPAGDPDATAAAVASLLDDPAEVERLRTAGPGRAAQFTPQASASRWDALLRRAVPTGCAPTGR